jgi:predicted aspartyl protease
VTAKLVLTIVVSMIATIGCGALSNGAAAPIVKAPEKSFDFGSPASPRHARIAYELNGRVFPLPFVHGTIAGVETWMLVDTGVSSHVVAGWLAHKVNAKLTKLGDIGTDHVGRSVTTYRGDHIAMSIDGWGTLRDAPVIVTEVPAFFETLGIGGLISPQQLDADEKRDAIVLDLAAGELYTSDDGALVSALDRAARKSIVSAGQHACSDSESPIHGLTFVVSARINEHDVRLLVDSGAERSDLLESSSAGHAFAALSKPNNERLFGASGPLTSRTLPSTNITVGDYARAVDLDLMPGKSDPFCERDGVVAMDVLRRCVLIFDRTHTTMNGRCI